MISVKFHNDCMYTLCTVDKKLPKCNIRDPVTSVIPNANLHVKLEENSKFELCVTTFRICYLGTTEHRKSVFVEIQSY